MVKHPVYVAQEYIIHTAAVSSAAAAAAAATASDVAATSDVAAASDVVCYFLSNFYFNVKTLKL